MAPNTPTGLSPAAPDFAAIVVAAGRSRRFGGRLPKQFLELSGRLVVERSVDRLGEAGSVAEIVVVLAPEHAGGPYAERLLAHPRVAAVVPGGDTRAASVAAGLAAVPDGRRYVLVHDAARPMVSPALIRRVIDATRAHGAAIPVLAVRDTVKRVDAAGQVERTLDRTPLRAAQTPQGAQKAALAAALAAGGAEDATDEAAALEAAGHRVSTVEGERANLKITDEQDLAEARRMLEGPTDLRVGNGFDVHRVDPSRPLLLGGVRFEGEPGLAGHSDADVVLHAAMDAILGAAAAGDIGVLFPPDDDRWAGADSRELSRTVLRKVRDAGFRIVNLDLTLLAERPKISPRAAEMRACVAETFELAVDRVGLKATTLEQLGSLGRHEGIACQAVALLSRTGP